ncbi:MAG: Fic family protein [Rikenellaceae bacterium]
MGHKEINFDEYIRQGEPELRERGIAWRTAIGLQQVDGLTTSEYLRETACAHIEGDITIEEVKAQLDNYYQSVDKREANNNRTEEADKVAARITEILSEQSFNLSVIEYLSIHKRLFEGIYTHAGKVREYNISKKEWVLDSESVIYGNAINLRETIEYDLTQEKNFDYRNLMQDDVVRHIAKFTSDLWQIHPFEEGNTRTTALFVIKYLRTLGFDVANDTFTAHSWYFRNALVRANYKNIQKGIFAIPKFIELFFRNLLMGEQNELRNRNLHILAGADTVNDTVNNTVNDTVNPVLQAIICNNKITLDELAKATNKSRSTVAREVKRLKEEGKISRQGSDKTGSWVITE